MVFFGSMHLFNNTILKHCPSSFKEIIIKPVQINKNKLLSHLYGIRVYCNIGSVYEI